MIVPMPCHPRKEPIRMIANLVKFTLALVFVAAPVMALDHQGESSSCRRPREPRAGTWRTYVLSSPSQLAVPPPPHRHSDQARDELAEVLALQAARSPEIEAVIDFWEAQP